MKGKQVMSGRESLGNESPLILRGGTIEAEDLMVAISKGQSISTRLSTVIVGNLEIKDIRRALNRDKDGRSIIQGSIEINTCEVRGDVCFTEVVFRESVELGQRISGQANFEYAVFEKKAYFGGTTFDGFAKFNSAIFKHDAFFAYASFKERAHFVYATFERRANFTEVQFSNSAKFLGASLRHPASFGNVKYDENTVPRGLWNYILHPRLWRIVWLLTLGRIKLKKLPVTDFHNLNTTTVMDGSSNPRLKRYIDDEQWIESWRKNPKGRWWREPLFWLWELMSHCGRSICLWIGWSAVFALVFAFIYRCFGNKSIVFSISKLGEELGFREYLYYSVVTFTTLGFGDIVPRTNWARLVVGVEVVLGYVMLGGLISIFANKFARRS